LLNGTCEVQQRNINAIIFVFDVENDLTFKPVKITNKEDKRFG